MVYGWGSNFYNALGVSDTILYPTPVAVNMSNIKPNAIITQLTAGEGMSTAITDESVIYKWGTFQDIVLTIPTEVQKGNLKGRVAKVVEGWQHVMFYTEFGKLFAFGSNQYVCAAQKSQTFFYNQPNRHNWAMEKHYHRQNLKTI